MQTIDSAILHEISKAIFSTSELKELLKIIIDSTMKVLSADDSSVMLFDRAGKLYIAASYGLSEEIQRTTRLAIGDRVTGGTTKDKQPLLIIDGLQNDERFKYIKGLEEIKTAIVIPLTGKTGMLGVLNINRVKDTAENFTESDLQTGNIFVGLAALSIEHSMLFEEVQKKNAQLIQSDKMWGLGILASGIAHEVNNPLTTILGNTQLILDEIPESNPLYEGLKEIEVSAQRCNRIISEFLSFSRQQNYKFALSDVNDVVEQTLRLCEHKISYEKTKIVINYGENLPKVNISVLHMQQVFLNIILNSLQSMPTDGTLTIKTRCVIAKDPNIFIGINSVLKQSQDGIATSQQVGSRYDKYIEISFNDTGVGIPEENLGKIFIPFFTTKTGTGLGLFVAYEIVRRHNGRIKVEKGDSDRGTKFTVELPVVENRSGVSDEFQSP